MSLDKDALGGQQRGREAIPGSGRMCLAQDLLLGSSKEATQVGGLRKPACPHTWESQFPAAPQLEIPTGSTLEKQPCGRGAHIPLSKPLPVQVSSEFHSRKKPCPGPKTGAGTLASRFPVEWLFHTFSWPPRKEAGKAWSGLILTASHPWLVPDTLTGLLSPRLHHMHVPGWPHAGTKQ